MHWDMANAADLTQLRALNAIILFVLGILGSTPVVRDAARRIDGTKVSVVLEAAAMLALLIVCTAYLVDGSFSPFLYFRF